MPRQKFQTCWAFKKAFHADIGCQLRLGGEGPEYEELKQLSTYLGLSGSVHFEGKKSKSEVLELLDQTHVFVLPSRFETFGVAIIEALSRGCPVVSTICGGPESIIPIECGILAEPENEDQLVEALRKIRTNYSKYNRNIIRQYAMQRFGPATFLQHMERVYMEDASRYSLVITEAEKTVIPELTP